MKKESAITIALVSLVTSISFAQTTKIEGVLTREYSTWDVTNIDPARNIYSTKSRAIIEISPDLIPRFAANFSSLGETSIQITAKAPRKKIFKMVAPGYYYRSYLGIFIQAEGYVGSNTRPASVSARFLREDGFAPKLSPYVRLSSSSGEGFIIESQNRVATDTPLTFKGIEISMTVPSAYSVDAYTRLNTFYLEGYASEPYGGIAPHPGQWLRIVDDPLVKELERQIRKLRRDRFNFWRKGKKGKAMKVRKEIRKTKLRIRMLD